MFSDLKELELLYTNPNQYEKPHSSQKSSDTVLHENLQKLPVIFISMETASKFATLLNSSNDGPQGRPV